MDQSIYEVTRDDYVGFLNQIKPSCRKVEVIGKGEPITELKVISITNNKHLASRFIYNNDEAIEEKYYIYEMPLPEERQAPTPVRKIVLETKEEVQDFFNALSKVMKEHDGNI